MVNYFSRFSVLLSIGGLSIGQLLGIIVGFILVFILFMTLLGILIHFGNRYLEAREAGMDLEVCGHHDQTCLGVQGINVKDI